MPLKVVRRKDTGALTISGTVAGQRVQRRAQSNDPRLAAEEAATLEAEMLRTLWHGERPGARSFASAVISYINAAPRRAAEKARLHRLLLALGDVPLNAIDQDTLARLRDRMLGQDRVIGKKDGSIRVIHGMPPTPETILRVVITPLRTVLRYAHRRGWCAVPAFETPKLSAGRTLYMTPDEAARLIAAAAPHLQPLLVFLLGTGARLSEALYLEWRDVDLVGMRAIFWADRTKSGKRRNVVVPLRAVAALANLGQREGPVFMTDRGHAYADRNGADGGQIKTAWHATIRRALLNPAFSPHTCRHSWASWHYAIHKDLLKLKLDGGWSSTSQVERYAHLMPTGSRGRDRGILGL
jgi:integrase